jgi:restriction system protein
MSEIAMPSSKELLDATLKCLETSGGKATNGQILDWTIKHLNLTSPQITAIRSGQRTELEYRLAWARTSAKRKGLIERNGPSSWTLVN